MEKDLGHIRREYSKHTLEETNLPEDPIILFNQWLDDARKSVNPEPTAMILSTIEKNGQPSSRVVLLKKIEDDLFIFFTNYNSRKASDINDHIRVSALFFWPELERQVKICGFANQIGVQDSDSYFHSRPRDSQIGAWASPQSKEVPDRQFLENEFECYRKKFQADKQIPRPPHWGGYAISPSRIEFWQGREARLHDRIEYRKSKNEWHSVRLAP